MFPTRMTPGAIRPPRNANSPDAADAPVQPFPGNHYAITLPLDAGDGAPAEQA